MVHILKWARVAYFTKKVNPGLAVEIQWQFN